MTTLIFAVSLAVKGDLSRTDKLQTHLPNCAHTLTSSAGPEWLLSKHGTYRLIDYSKTWLTATEIPCIELTVN